MKTGLKYLTLEELLGRLTFYQEKLTLAIAEKETAETAIKEINAAMKSKRYGYFNRRLTGTPNKKGV
jgi:hypothetical protein